MVLKQRDNLRKKFGRRIQTLVGPLCSVFLSWTRRSMTRLEAARNGEASASWSQLWSDRYRFRGSVVSPAKIVEPHSSGGRSQAHCPESARCGFGSKRTIEGVLVCGVPGVADIFELRLIVLDANGHVASTDKREQACCSHTNPYLYERA